MSDIKLDNVQMNQIEKIEGSLSYAKSIIERIKEKGEYVANGKNGDLKDVKTEVLAVNHIINSWLKKEMTTFQN